MFADMELNIKDYLKKFETLLPVEVQVRNAVVDSVKTILGSTLDRKSIRLQGTQVFITGSAAFKSELAMKQQKILSYIKEQYPKVTVTKIM